METETHSGSEDTARSCVVDIVDVSLTNNGLEDTESSSVVDTLDISLSQSSGPCQPRLTCFPKTVCGKQYRCFQSSWYNKYPWVEYSEKRDAAYCFCCRWFRSGISSTGGSNDVFVNSGFKSWQKAIQAGRGLQGHEQSAYHKACFQSWKLWQGGQANSSSIAHQLSQTQMARNRTYVAYIADLVRFLVTHEKPFRGTDETIGSETCGFFLAVMERDMSNQQELKQAVDSIPKNCTYTSAESQNEIVDIWFYLLQKEIVKRVSSSAMFCVMADETRNKNNVEDMCVCVRHVDDEFVAHEYLLDVVPLRSLNASELSRTLLTVLEETVGTDKLVAQSYDGASVMSGAVGGVQALISDAIGRKIIYIHCFAHRLHLVVLRVLEASSHVTWILDICQQLYSFFRRYSVARQYSDVGGRKLKRILEQRWTGHHQSVCAVLAEFENIMQTLHNIARMRIAEAIEAAGLIKQLKHCQFMPVLQTVKDTLDILMPLNMAFQSEKIDIGTGLTLIDAVRSKLIEIVDKLEVTDVDEERTHCHTDVGKVVNDEVPSNSSSECKDGELPAKVTEVTVDNAATINRRSSRNIVRPKRLVDYVVEIKQINKEFDNGTKAHDYNPADVSDGEETADKPDGPDEFSVDKLKLLLAQSVLCELDHRFGEQQREVYSAAASLAASNFTAESLKPLVQAAREAGVYIDSEMLSHEIPIARAVLSNESLQHNRCACTSKLAEFASQLHPPSHQNLLLLYRFTMTMALDTAKAERSFSTVKRLLSDYRRSMTHERLRHLTVLCHEKVLLKSITIETFLSAFKKDKRRLMI